MNKYKYPTDIDISYNNTHEYRECLRTLFQMNTVKQLPAINEDEVLDDETLDELNYDNDASTVALNYIYKKTKDNPIFRELYSAAAAKMFSIDHETGMAIMMSYDHLMRFHKCLVCFFKTPENFTINNHCFRDLYRRI